MISKDVDSLIASGREFQIDAERRRKRGDLETAGLKIGLAAIDHLKAICISENIPCDNESDYFKAVGEVARRYRTQTINRHFGAAMLLYMNGISGGTDVVKLTGDQIKTYFKDVQKLIHLIRDRLRYA
jgi:hypothetical protein